HPASATLSLHDALPICDGVRVVPLDSIASVQRTKSAGILDWLTGQVLLVTTADGAEYEFRGMMAGWQADIADALTVRGREVHAVDRKSTRLNSSHVSIS